MKKLLFFVLLLQASIVFGQQNRYIYIYSANQQTFYVKSNGVIYSSSTTGYLLMPRLKPGWQVLKLGFPKNQIPEQTIEFELKDQNLAFYLKANSDNVLSLVNSITQDVVYANKNGGAAKPVAVSVVEPSPNNETIIKNKPTEEIKTERIKVEPIIEAPKRVNTIKKIYASLSNTKYSGVYSDSDFPNQIDVEIELPQQLKQQKNCSDTATTDDLVMLVKEMMLFSSEFDMIRASTKPIKEKCFTAHQLLSISNVLTSDEAKFKLFEFAQQHIANKANFSVLSNKLQTSLYKQKFQQLLSK